MGLVVEPGVMRFKCLCASGIYRVLISPRQTKVLSSMRAPKTWIVLPPNLYILKCTRGVHLASHCIHIHGAGVAGIMIAKREPFTLVKMNLKFLFLALQALRMEAQGLGQGISPYQLKREHLNWQRRTQSDKRLKSRSASMDCFLGTYGRELCSELYVYNLSLARLHTPREVQGLHCRDPASRLINTTTTTTKMNLREA